MAEQFSWVPSPYCSPPGHPFPIKSLALSAVVSPWTIHFQVLDKSPVLGPRRGPPFCNRMTKQSTTQQAVVQLLSSVCLFCDPIYCSQPGSSVHGISQARILEWVVISFSRRSSSAGRFFTTEPLNIYTHTHTHTHIYITSCLSIHLFVAGRRTSSRAQNWALV